MLNDKRLRSLTPRAARYEIPDSAGLSVRVMPGGSITFQYRYRLHRKPERLMIGHYPHTSLDEARDKHRAARKLVKQGISPALRKKSEDMAIASAESVRQLAGEFMERYINVKRKRPDNAEQMLNADVIPKLGPLKVKDVTRRHVTMMLDAIVDRKANIQANRTSSLVKQMFQFAVDRGMIEANPCSSIRRQTVGGTEKGRDRNLSPGEIKTFWNKLDAATAIESDRKKGIYPIGKAMVTALKVLLVTGQRRGELVKAKKSDVDLGKAIWTIPAENSKNGRAHRVPLPPLAVTLFKELISDSGDSLYVLPSPALVKGADRNDIHITERALTKAAERARGVVGIDHWVPHDLRRTSATQLAELGTLPHVVEKVLNHTMQGVMGIYNRHDYAEEMRVALNAWAERLLLIATTDASKVVPLQRKAVAA